MGENGKSYKICGESVDYPSGLVLNFEIRKFSSWRNCEIVHGKSAAKGLELHVS
jgi:hypothetical protein